MINQVGISDAAKVATVSMNAFGLKASVKSARSLMLLPLPLTWVFCSLKISVRLWPPSASVAKLSNQGLTDITSALIALTNNGQSAADAGTSIKSALLALTNPSAEARRCHEATGHQCI
jgi:hypothetical protein